MRGSERETARSSRADGWDHRFPAVVLLVIAAVLVARAPRVFFHLRLFADEVTYFESAFGRPWLEVLVSPLLGYYSLLPNLGAVLGVHVLPLELAPLPNIWLGTLSLLTPPLLVLLPGSPIATRRLQLLAVALLVVVPPSQGRVDVVYAQYYMGLAAALILVSHSPTAATRRIRLAISIVAGLTGGLAAALAPLFWWSAWWERSSERSLQALVLSGCALVQLAAVVSGAPESGGDGPAFARLSPIEADVALPATAIKSVALPLLGRSRADALGRRVEGIIATEPGSARYWATLGVSAASIVALLTLVLGPRRRPVRGRPLPASWLLVAGALTLAGLSFGAGLTMGGSRVAYLSGHHRYFSAPNGMLIVALVLAAAGSGVRARIGRVVIAWLLVVGTFTFFAEANPGHLGGPSWRKQVARWRADPDHAIRVWPFWWSPVKLTPSQVRRPAD